MYKIVATSFFALLSLLPIGANAQSAPLEPIVVQAPSAADELRNLPIRPLATTLPATTVRSGGVVPLVRVQDPSSSDSQPSDVAGESVAVAPAPERNLHSTGIAQAQQGMQSLSASSPSSKDASTAYLHAVVRDVANRHSSPDAAVSPTQTNRNPTQADSGIASRDTVEASLGDLPADKAGNPVYPDSSTPSTDTVSADPRGTLPDPYAAQPRIFPQNSPLQLRVDTAARAYRERGRARTLQVGQMVVYPYGHVTPQVETQLLRVTLVELAPGEHMVDSFIGDAARFQIDTGVSGSQADFTQLVSIKPLDCGLVTNMAITTNVGRTYALDLISQPCDVEAGELPTGDYTRHVRWYYPDGTVDRGNATKRSYQAPRVDDFSSRGNSRFTSSGISNGASGPDSLDEAPVPMGQGGGAYYSSRSPADEVRLPPGSVNLEDFNTDYRVRTDRRFPCEPEMVGDDGQRTYILMDPDDPLCRETFPVYEERDGRNLAMVNYDVMDGYMYVIEGLHLRLKMVDRSSSSGREQYVRIDNNQLRDRLRNRGRSR